MCSDSNFPGYYCWAGVQQVGRALRPHSSCYLHAVVVRRILHSNFTLQFLNEKNILHFDKQDFDSTYLASQWFFLHLRLEGTTNLGKQLPWVALTMQRSQ